MSARGNLHRVNPIARRVHAGLTGVQTAAADGAAAGAPKTITSATCEDQHSQRRYVIKAKAFIDTTGDGRLGAEAGAGEPPAPRAPRRRRPRAHAWGPCFGAGAGCVF